MMLQSIIEEELALIKLEQEIGGIA